MDAKDKVDLAIRAGIVAHSVLALIGTSSKFHAKIVMKNFIKHAEELNSKINGLQDE